MPIKEPLLLISIDDFKTWKGFDKLLFENVTNSDENIWFAISIASSNIDYLSGFAISKKWPEQTVTTFTDNVQTATAHYVRFLCTKGVDYTRGQASMAQGGIVYSESNPNDPYYIPPEVFNYLRNIKEYTAFQGFNLNVTPKTSFFSKFLSNKGEINPLENYLQITNTIAGNGIVIEKTHPPNIMGTVVTISTDLKTFIQDSDYIYLNDKDQLLIKTDSNEVLAQELLAKNEYTSLNTTKHNIIDAINEIFAKPGTPITVDSDYFTLTSGKLGLKTAFNEQLAQTLLKTNKYDALTTTAKTVVEAINEVLADATVVENEVTAIQNQLVGVNSDIDALKFQNFDINFHSIMLTETDQYTKMMGKITIGLGTLFQSVWSITSRSTKGYDMKIQDLGLYFHCYKINGVIENSVKYVTGAWSGDNFLIDDFHGYQVEEPDENTYSIHFYDANTSEQCTLTLNITPLKSSVTHVNDNPKNPKINDFIAMQNENIEIKRQLKELLEFKKIMMKRMGDD